MKKCRQKEHERTCTICFPKPPKYYQKKRERICAILEAKKWTPETPGFDDRAVLCYNLINATLNEAIRLINS